MLNKLQESDFLHLASKHSEIRLSIFLCISIPSSMNTCKSKSMTLESKDACIPPSFSNFIDSIALENIGLAGSAKNRIENWLGVARTNEHDGLCALE